MLLWNLWQALQIYCQVGYDIYIYIIYIYVNCYSHFLIGETYVTASAFLPVLKLLEDDILKEKEEDTPLTNSIRTTILADLSTRNLQPDVVELLKVSCFLDPRFKSNNCLNEEDISDVKAVVCSDGVLVVESMQSLSQSDDGSATRPPPAKKKRTLGSFFKGKDDTAIENSGATNTPEQKTSVEIDRYLAEEDLDSEEDPLKWWKDHTKKYPILSQVCKKYLSIPATSSPSERLFSRAGNIVTPLRNSLKPEMVDMLTFLSSNVQPPS